MHNVLKISHSKSFSSFTSKYKIYRKNYSPCTGSVLRSGNSLNSFFFFFFSMLILRSEIPTVWKATNWPKQPSSCVRCVCVLAFVGGGGGGFFFSLSLSFLFPVKQCGNCLSFCFAVIHPSLSSFQIILKRRRSLQGENNEQEKMSLLGYRPCSRANGPDF